MTKSNPENDSPRLWLRRRGTSATWYIRFRGETFPTGCRENEIEQAKKLLVAFEGRQSSTAQIRKSVLNLEIGEIIAYAEKKYGVVITDSRRNRRSAQKYLTKVKIIAKFWSKLYVKDFSDEGQKKYIKFRQNSRGPYQGESGVSEQTAYGELTLLRMIINGFAEDRGLIGRVSVRTKKFVHKRRPIVSRSDLARLLWAALGFAWNSTTKRFERPLSRKSRAIKKIRRRRSLRFLLLSAYSGTQQGCIVNLKWDGTPNGCHSYIDLTDDQVKMYRLGPDSPPGKLEGKPVHVNWRLAAHLKRWRRIDGKNYKGHILKGDARSKGGPSIARFESFKKLVADAGISTKIQPGDVAYSAGVHLARNPDISIRSSAIMLGMNVSSFLEKFGVYRPKYQSGAIAALMRKPSTIR